MSGVKKMILAKWKLIFLFLPMLYLLYWKVKRGNFNRGLHFNLDYPERDDMQLKDTVVSKKMQQIKAI